MSKGRATAAVKASHKAHKKAKKAVTARYVSALHAKSGFSGTLESYNNKNNFMAKTKGGKPNPEYVALVKLSASKAKKAAAAPAKTTKKVVPKKGGKKPGAR